MDENSKNINLKTRILLARNTPVALVVGAAGFLGSNLAEKLLEKGIQVVGVDNLSGGNKNNLEKAVKSKNFHLIDSSAQDLELELERLDYIFIVAGKNWNIDKILKIFLEKKARCLFVSWIDLYDKTKEEEYSWFKETESKLAKFAKEHNLNARILRLGPIFGPSMHFEIKEPTVRLIYSQLKGEIQNQEALEFSSRALYILDAVDLMVKSIFAGATAQKIFDGVLPTPVKVSDVKQVLLDPLWYDRKGFEPQELPPWPTPNLEKTMKVLHWRPRVSLVEGLRRTLAYFKDNEIKVPDLEVGEERKEWREEKKEQLQEFKVSQIPKKTKPGLKISFPMFKIYLVLAVSIIVVGLLYPLVILGWGIASFKIELENASNNLSKGDFDKSLSSLARAKIGIDEAQSFVDSIEIIRAASIFQPQFEQADQLLALSKASLISVQSAVKGVQFLYQGLKATTGEIEKAPFDYFTQAQVELAFADENLSSALALIKSKKFKAPKIIDLEEFNQIVKKAHAASIILPKIISSNRSYLILLQNNMELRPAGGFIGSYGLISFEGGKLKKLDVDDIYTIDEKLAIHVEPPKEIKEDLGQKDWFLRDSNWESDFPTSAKQAEWFFNKETGIVPAGVIGLDITAMEEIFKVLGPLELLDYNEKITWENLFEKAITHAEQFPGSQTKKSFLTALTAQTFNKLFFLPNQNWPGIVAALGKSLEEKHVSIYLDDPKLFSYLVSQGWGGVLPRAQDPKEGVMGDFLAPVEANLGANKANYYLDRSYDLETVIGNLGEVKHRLKINYTNRSSSDTWPAGKYKNRLRIYFPFGTKLIRALWGETNITKDASAFVDFGRATYSMLLELASKEQKALILDYEIPGNLEFKDGEATYRLDIIKQAGTLKDPLNWKITYPINYKVSSKEVQAIGPQEQNIQTDLSKDRSFEVKFTK